MLAVRPQRHPASAWKGLRQFSASDKASLEHTEKELEKVSPARETRPRPRIASRAFLAILSDLGSVLVLIPVALPSSPLTAVCMIH